MKVIHNRKKHTNEMYDVTLVCSPIEALTIMSSLRRMADSKDAHEKDRPLAKRLYETMKAGGR